MNLHIDTERPGDFLKIHELVKIAFQTAEHADGDEQDYVDNLRMSDRYIPELAFTVRDNEVIIAHIMLTKTGIYRGHHAIPALLLSPVCVLLEHRKKGVAARLISFALQKAKEYGFKAVFLVGEPGYYSRFGFRSIADFYITNTGDIPDKYNMVLELEKGYLGTSGGQISIV